MRRAFGVLVLAVFMVAPSLAHATSWTFTKVADTNTAIPGGTGNFTSFSTPSLDGGNVAFNGMGAGQDGIYTYIGGSLAVVADKNTAIPGGTGNFTVLYNPSVDGGKVAFTGDGSGQQGIYTNVGGSLAVVADLNTAIPGGTGNFTNLYAPCLDGGNIAFWGANSPDQAGIYTAISGSLAVVADKNTAIPGGAGNFTDLFSPALQSVNVAFMGWGIPNQIGIYMDIGGSLSMVADRYTAIPAGTGNFNGYYSPCLDGGNVAFNGWGTDQDGIYTYIGGTLAVVADRNTAIPSGTGNFTSFESPSLDGGNVAFVGRGVGQTGIYTNIGGSLEKVIDLTDTLDGKTISFLLLGREALSEGAIAFWVEFTDGSDGIYTATPEPATVGLIVLGIGGLLFRRKSTTEGGKE